VRACRVALGVVATAAAFVAASAASAATAAPITIGSPLTATFNPVPFEQTFTVANIVLGEPGAHVTSPVNGVIVRWRIEDAAGGPFELEILTPAPRTDYIGGARSAPETPRSGSIQTFSTDLPIKAGQTIGLDNTNSNAEIGGFLTSSATFVAWSPIPDGASGGAPVIRMHEELAFNADVVPSPAVSGLSPASGSEDGGTRVFIVGQDLTGATRVDFGGRAAPSFRVVSDNGISAVVPASAHTGPVSVTVTTPGGTSARSGADRFTYELPPRPTVSKLTPASGITAGGTAVVIRGRDLTRATRVTFGLNPARGFTFISDTEIKAVSPSHAGAGSVSVRVTTPGGTSAESSGDRFTYRKG
jgi:hypothetical protein